ncbi:hypothetical protein OFEAOIEE_LOCUS1123 [Methylorubrum extorquens]
MPFVEYNGKKILFVHIPKTGGGSVETWLETLGTVRLLTVGSPNALKCTPQHFRMSDIRDVFGDGYFDYIFMTVRNPYDRVMSEYKMHALLSGSGFWKAWPSFSHWLEHNLNLAHQNPYHLDNHLRPQWEFSGTGIKVFKFEEGMESILNRVAADIGAPTPVVAPHIHSTGAENINASFDVVDRIRMASFYEKDFDIFGYSTQDFGKTKGGGRVNVEHL